MIAKPHDINMYRDRTAGMLVLNHARRTCTGPCRRRRSVGQFAGKDTVCKQCRRRA